MINVTELPALVHKGIDYRRVFADTGSKNDLDCNLTELRVAADATNNNPDENDQANSIGFTRHTDSWGHLLRYYYAGKMITKLEPSHILDVGCGELQLPWFLNKNRFKPVANTQYVGIELRGQAKWLQADEEGKHKYRYKAHMTLVRGDIVRDDFSQTPGWASGGFPLVIFLEALEHFPREYAPVAMQRLFNWTKPGGVCLFSTPNAGVSVSTAENHTGPDGVSREWSYKDKIAMVQAAGFEIVETFGTFTGMSYMPAEVQEFVKTDPIWSKMKRFYDPTLFCSVIATAYPEHSNNSIFHLRRPA